MTTKYFHKDTNNDTSCESTNFDPVNADFDQTQGSETTLDSATVQAALEDILLFEVDVSGDTPSSGIHDNSLSVATASPASEFHYRMITGVRNSSCATQGSNDASPFFTGTGIKTDTTASLSLPDVLHINLQGQRISGHGNKSLTADVNHADSFIDTPWGVAEVEEVPLLMSQYQPT